MKVLEVAGNPVFVSQQNLLCIISLAFCSKY